MTDALETDGGTRQLAADGRPRELPTEVLLVDVELGDGWTSNRPVTLWPKLMGFELGAGSSNRVRAGSYRTTDPSASRLMLRSKESQFLQRTGSYLVPRFPADNHRAARKS